MELPISELSFLIFIIPGFIVVWTFRYFSKSHKTGDFEFLGLSFVWGLILLMLVGLLSKIYPKIINLFQNAYVASLGLCMFAFILGWFGSSLTRWKWFKKVVDFIRPGNFGK